MKIENSIFNFQVFELRLRYYFNVNFLLLKQHMELCENRTFL